MTLSAQTLIYRDYRVAINIELKLTATAIIPERKWLNTVCLQR